jgi:aminobenzoyl-glutamate utilization protein B
MTALADQIWSLAELRYAENASAQLHIDALQQAGFRITRDVAGIPTAFMAEWGDTGPVIALLGEYDALSGLNQQSGALVCTRPPTALVWPATAAATICWALRRTLPLLRCSST